MIGDEDDDESSGATPSRSLSKTGTDSERRLLAAAHVGNVPDDAIRRRVFARVLAAETPRRMARWPLYRALAAVAGFGLAAGTALMLNAHSVHLPGGLERSALSAESFAERRSPSLPAPELPLARTACAKVVVAPGLDALVDDFEDGNANLLPLEHRQGTWHIATDGTGSLSEPPLSPMLATRDTPEYLGGTWHPTRMPRARAQSRYALHTRGGKFTAWGVVASAQFALEPGACYDASAYAGLAFWGKGTSRLAVSARMVDTTPVSNGGFCESDCFKRHVRQIELGPEWQRYAVPWSELVDYAPALAFDPKRLWGIDFVVVAGSTPFELWLDDVSFLASAGTMHHD